MNGDFSSGLANWTLPVHGDYAGSPVSTGSVTGGELHIDITSGGNVAWAISASQQISMTNGNTYVVTFQAKASASRSMNYGLGLNHDAYTSYVEKNGELDYRLYNICRYAQLCRHHRCQLQSLF